MNNIGWQGWVVVSGLLSGVAQAIGKRQVAQMSAFQSGLLRDGTILLIMLGIALSRGGVAWEATNWIWLGIGMLEAVMMAAYYSASREELASTVIFSYPLSSVLIVMLSGAFFGEWQYFDPRNVHGLANILAVVAIIFLMFKYQNGKLAKTRWSTKLVLSSLMVVVSNLATKWAVSTLGVRPENYMLYEYLGLVIVAILYIIWRGQGMRVGWRQVAWGAVQGVFFALSVLIFLAVLKSYPLSIASTLRRSMIVVTTVVMGLLWYGERKRMSRQQIWILVVATVVLGVVLGVN